MKLSITEKYKRTIRSQAYEIEGLELELRLTRAERDNLARLLADHLQKDLPKAKIN
jgi:hypothetical protein